MIGQKIYSAILVAISGRSSGKDEDDESNDNFRACGILWNISDRCSNWLLVFDPGILGKSGQSHTRERKGANWVNVDRR